MPEINLNLNFADLLKNHGINVEIADEFIQTDLPNKVKFKARTEYTTAGGNINSRLDVMALTDKGEQIIESCGDVGSTIEDAVSRNFKNFSMGSLHPLLASLGCIDPHTYDQITIDEWEINNKNWKSYIGNLVPKIITNSKRPIAPPFQFFDNLELAIKSQRLTNRLHWFRGYYSQLDDRISTMEFLVENVLHDDTEKIFSTIPIIPQTKFYSCRVFIVLKNMDFD